MTARDLQALLGSSEPPLLVHVLPAEVYKARRIPGSHSACVYEVSFPEQVAAIVRDKSQPLVVYGAGGGSMDAIIAAEKLTALGYPHVRAFPGGLEEWQASGLPLECDAAPPQAPALDGRYEVDTGESVIRWTGRNLFNFHSGTVRFASGEIILENNNLVSSRMQVAMDSIACEDIHDPALNRQLIEHLRSDDFFDVARHPTAEFVSQSATPIPQCTEGTPNHILQGHFTLRGITRELDLPIQTATDDGRRLTAQATLDLDRTQFGSLYGSGRFFRFLGKHLVNDHFHLHLKLHAHRSP